MSVAILRNSAKLPYPACRPAGRHAWPSPVARRRIASSFLDENAPGLTISIGATLQTVAIGKGSPAPYRGALEFIQKSLRTARSPAGSEQILSSGQMPRRAGDAYRYTPMPARFRFGHRFWVTSAG